MYPSLRILAVFRVFLQTLALLQFQFKTALVMFGSKKCYIGGTSEFGLQ